ncbi:MAG: hypothetical protein QOH49_544 [Acidobacteriota bacterium]|jgi:hypothetical protein|nr:hypothetical protein [Acidobacteriota bacterium]
MRTRLTWVNSAGGPLVLLEEHLLPEWRGHDGSTAQEHEGRTDYERACDVDDYLGLVEVGSGRALVLGDEPMQTTWCPSPEGSGVVLLRWQWADSEAAVIDAAGDMPEESWESTGLIFQTSGRDLVLFDSAYPGDEPGERLTIQLARGQYGIDTAHYRPDAETSLVLHRLVGAGS